MGQVGWELEQSYLFFLNYFEELYVFSFQFLVLF